MSAGPGTPYSNPLQQPLGGQTLRSQYLAQLLHQGQQQQVSSPAQLGEGLASQALLQYAQGRADHRGLANAPEGVSIAPGDAANPIPQIGQQGGGILGALAQKFGIHPGQGGNVTTSQPYGQDQYVPNFNPGQVAPATPAPTGALGGLHGGLAQIIGKMFHHPQQPQQPMLGASGGGMGGGGLYSLGQKALGFPK